MSDLHPAALAVRQRAEALLGDRQLALATDTDTWPSGPKAAVLLAIARPHGSIVLAIDAREWSATGVALLAGWEPAPPKTAQQRLTGEG